MNNWAPHASSFDVFAVFTPFRLAWAPLPPRLTHTHTHIPEGASTLRHCAGIMEQESLKPAVHASVSLSLSCSLCALRNASTCQSDVGTTVCPSADGCTMSFSKVRDGVRWRTHAHTQMRTYTRTYAHTPFCSGDISDENDNIASSMQVAATQVQGANCEPDRPRQPV